MNTLNKIKSMSTQDILRALRVRTGRSARSALPMLGGLGAGLAMGAGITALFTPKTGSAVRKLLSERAHTVAAAVSKGVNRGVNKGMRSAGALVS